MEYRILGPLEVLGDDGTPITLAGIRERTLLATLLLSVNHVVSTDRLIDVLWGEEPPPSAVNAVQVYVSKLRRKLEAVSGASPIRTEYPGYVLATLPGELDAERFEEWVRSSEATGPEEAVTRLTEALSLWRGEVLGGLDLDIALRESNRLDELRLVAMERRADAELSLGHHQELVGELESIASEHPLRERLQGQLMVALYRCGRQGDALAVYRRTRTTLTEELGIDPSKPLQDLELAILNQAPEIGAPTVEPAKPPSIRATGGEVPLTFLFTDIERSTEKLARLRDAYTELLAGHNEIIRASLASHQGREINTAGDGFFAVFTSPSACMSAVIEMQQALASYEWPDGEEVRVRMGVHTGEASEEAVGLVGLEVNRAARIAAVGHGGQVLLSSATAALLRDSLPDGVRFRDLGAHRLKDLGRAEQIFQLEANGLATDFPPLRSLDNPELPNNLPGFLSAFIGRETELAEIRSLVESSRLVTLTGAGGSGKTRLALQVAAELLDGSGEGVWFVDLATIAEAEQVPGAVAAALGISEQAGRPPLETLLEVLREQRVLIVLDNCEHVVDACAKLGDLVERGCHKVHLMATSREPLGIDGEHVYRVRPLSLPSEEAITAEDLEGSDAVELFVERARSHDSTFALEDSVAGLVASICRRLDGIPFAIELAAARLASMSLVNLNDRLDHRFRLLTGGTRNALPRQQTLQATVDWSFDLLSDPERAVLCRLSVFVGSFELGAAEAVCATPEVDAFEVADLLGLLVNKSLVVAERSSGLLRYRLLETIRQYAADQLVRTGGEAETRRARSAHAQYYLQLSETAAPELTGPRQGPWLKRMDLEWDNLRATLAYLSAGPDRTEDVLRLGVALHRFFASRGHLEPIANLRATLERPDPVPVALRARALYATGYLVLSLLGMEDRQEVHTAGELFERALEMARDLDDRGFLSEALSGLSGAAAYLEETTRATLLGEEALEVARSLGDPSLIGWALRNLELGATTPEMRQARHLEAIACFRQAGDIHRVCLMLANLAGDELAHREVEAARAHFEEAIAVAEEIPSSRYLPSMRLGLGLILFLQGELEEAELSSRKALIAYRRLGRPGVNAAFAIFLSACCATGTGDYRRAAQLTGAHDVIDADIMDVAPKGGFDWTTERQAVGDDVRARLREALGDDEFERAYTVGRGLSFEEAVDLALGKVRST